ncbi:hypothetical protein PILCRDRAFT_817051 [Piloderma croceum F 1598]|uniref:Uncharacterized protein n=1 Tax=Piloderma croceum (strain F 1598) TaxID=765440 RepID=A0A0C3G1U6_PILCF|nr:hypothetical protein PILCRDRAFT_817051 [Piloderma croceum F 1598]
MANDVEQCGASPLWQTRSLTTLAANVTERDVGLPWPSALQVTEMRWDHSDMVINSY